MRGAHVWLFCLVVTVGCGKKRTEPTTTPEPEVTRTGTVTPPNYAPKPPAPSVPKIEYTPDASGFSASDPKVAIRWLGTEFARIQKRAPRDPEFGSKGTKELYATLEGALIGKQVRWPMAVGLVDKFGMVNLDPAGYPESFVPESPGKETYSLNVGSRPKNFAFGVQLPAKEPRDWIRAVRPKDQVLVVGTIKNVERHDYRRNVPGQPPGMTYHWDFELIPGWVEPWAAGK